MRALVCQRQRDNNTVSLPARVGGVVRLSVLWWLALAVCISVSCVYGWNYLANRSATGQGSIELSGIKLEQSANQLNLQAAARIRLPPKVRAGLDSGVPLTFVLKLNVSKLRRFWPDVKVFESQRHYTLTYYELTRHYRVSEVESDYSRNYRSLSSALAGLGRLGRIRFELNEKEVPALDGDGLVASLEMRLSKSALPLPLQPIIRSSWTLVSEEYRWPVT